MEQNVKPARNGVAIAVGEMKWTDEEAKRLFTDSSGRVHDALYVDDDGRPARDKDGRLLDAMPSIGGYAYSLTEDEDEEETAIETMNVAFLPKCVINI